MSENHRSAPRRWGARRHGLVLGGMVAVVSLIAAPGFEFATPAELIIVERLLPRSDHLGPIVRNSIEPMANFKDLNPADVWLTWQMTTPVGADSTKSVLGAMRSKMPAPK
jgi:hypothetical protein